jgi:hypothetical protein
MPFKNRKPRLLYKCGLNNVYKKIPVPVKDTQMLKAPARVLAATDETVRIDIDFLHYLRRISDPLRQHVVFDARRSAGGGWP